MGVRPKIQEFVFATANANKVFEVQNQLSSKVHLKSLVDIGCFEEIPETSDTIQGNAIQKARYVFKNYGYSCFADDTGLEIESLDGAPGIYSARYAGPKKSAEANISKVLLELQDQSNRTAQFRTVIALQLGEAIHTFEGICKGVITLEKRGASGFGYDPIFIPDGYKQTFAEMAIEQKNEISHRAKAVTQFVSFIDTL